MTTLTSYPGLSLVSATATRTKLFLDYEEELGRLPEYVEMYRRSGKVRLIPQDSIDFVTTVLDQSEALIELNRSLVPHEPVFTSVYTKTTSSGNPRPTLTAYDLKRFHGFRNQVTDLVVLEGIRDVHAVLLHFAENETAEAFAHAAFGLEFGAPYIQTTQTVGGIEYFVINFLFNDESMKLASVRETYSFMHRFMDAYPDLPHIRVEMNDDALCKLYLDSNLVLATAEAYKEGRPAPMYASCGFSLLGNFAFHQEGWNTLPTQFSSDEQIIATLEHMQLDVIPTYNRLLKDGLEVLQDDRSFLPQTELEYVREKVGSLIWDEVIAYFSQSISGFEKLYSVLLEKKEIDTQTVKAIIEAKESFENSRKQLAQLRTNFGRIVPRLSGLRSVSVGAEYRQTVRELELAYELSALDKKRSFHFILELEGFGRRSIKTLPRIVGFYGFLKIIMAIFSQRAFRKNRDQRACYLHTRFSPSIIENEGYLNVLLFATGQEMSATLLQALNDPLEHSVPTKNSGDIALKNLQELFAHIYKIPLYEGGKIRKDNVQRLRQLFRVGNLSERDDDLSGKTGFFLEIHFPAFGRIEDFRRK
ncbi:MAG: hypothetical protein N2691_05735 [Patescibacteria group bacterium]|nr:hypothetical protein [Patescibacteria group bacterium]